MLATQVHASNFQQPKHQGKTQTVPKSHYKIISKKKLQQSQGSFELKETTPILKSASSSFCRTLPNPATANIVYQGKMSLKAKLAARKRGQRKLRRQQVCSKRTQPQPCRLQISSSSSSRCIISGQAMNNSSHSQIHSNENLASLFRSSSDPDQLSFDDLFESHSKEEESRSGEENQDTTQQ